MNRLQDEIELLCQKVREEVGISLRQMQELSDEDILTHVTQIVMDRSRENYLSLNEKQKVIDTVFNSLRRLDILQPLLEDQSVTEIMINAPDQIFIEREGRVRQLGIHFESTERLENIIQAVVSQVNRVVNEASPVVDARLRDGSRVNVVLPPIAIKGPTMTIRKFPDKPLTAQNLVDCGTLTEETVSFLRKIVQAKYNIFISGGTGSGKTTFLNVLSNFIPAGERIITIEDSAELQLRNIENLVSLETRNANTEGKGEVTIRDLIRTSLRMRPDRIIVGEVRGAEAADMLQAMNTGHDGSLSTGHANSTKDMLSRLETMVLSSTPLPIEVIRKQIGAAIDIIIHLGRLRDGSRKVLEISELLDLADGEISLNRLFEFEETGEVNHKVIGTIKSSGSRIINTLKLKMAGICPK